MLLLTSITDLIQVVTSATSGSGYGVKVQASWVDNLSNVITPGRTNTSITTATTATIVGSPAASTQRNTRFLSIRNDHVTDSCLVEVRHTDGTTVITIVKGTLLAGESFILDQDGDWYRLDSNGVRVVGSTAFKAATALPTAVAAGSTVTGGSDVYGRQLGGLQKLPGMQKSFAFNTTSTATGGAIWTPTSGNRIVVTSITISLYGTTGGRVIVWFGASGDTTYSAGTDQPLEIMSGVPSATIKPGITKSYSDGVVCQNVDYVLRVTSDAAVSMDITVHGYELVG